MKYDDDNNSIQNTKLLPSLVSKSKNTQNNAPLHRDGKSKSLRDFAHPCAKMADECLRQNVSEPPRLESPGEKSGPGQKR